ncbi:MAG: hypothetical protein CUN52_07855 [Phototrophicales bacterium]|nr:MAG: hypothetical protein CUN52_07855 [Phototrophicales bacterium]
MMMMGDKVFLDTNIVLRVLLRKMDLHTNVDVMVKQMIREEKEFWISGQIIREFMVQATHPKTLQKPLTMNDVVHELQLVKSLFKVADETTVVRDTLLQLVKQYPIQGKQVHDANIVATMLAHDIPNLFTLNVVDFQRFADKINIITL